MRNIVNGLIVSTVNSIDMGYETAIVDVNGVYPVERYESSEMAEKGHMKWIEKAKTIEKVNMLDWLNSTNYKEIILTRMPYINN